MQDWSAWLRSMAFSKRGTGTALATTAGAALKMRLPASQMTPVSKIAKPRADHACGSSLSESEKKGRSSGFPLSSKTS